MRTLLARTGLVLLAATASVFAGCAEERDPISRVQPNAIPKTFFLGPNIQDASDDPEFRMKSVVVDSSVSQSQYSIGEFSAVDRIRWEVTEGMLIGRRSYQESPGADNRGVPGDKVSATNDKSVKNVANGTIVAAFKILKHFDVRHDYNSATGEEQNVIVENDSDRPWAERDYIRVDWSQNLVDSTNDQTRYFHNAKVTPVQYNITDPNAEDAPHMELDGGYLDVTNKFTVEADQVQFSWGSIPRCVLISFFTGTSSYDCNAQEATVRTSFAKVQKDEDFEPFEDNVAWQDVVGNTGGSGDGFNPWLGVARTTWDPQYGFNDAQTHRLKSIHNIWKKSHQDKTCGSNEDKDKNGTADACENTVTGYSGKSGSQCDTIVGKCTIPVRDREIKTIAYHLNSQAPDAFQDQVDPGDAKKITEHGVLEGMGTSWSQLISVSVAYRREVECRRTGDGNRDACHAEFFDSDRTPAGKQAVNSAGWLTDKPKALDVDKGKPGFYVCHNPVRAYDPEDVCGKAGDKARLGDVRKNHLIYWPYESRAHYGGVGWNPPDPVTGETFGATATIMGRSATRAAAMQRDIIQIAMGDTQLEDVMNGVPAARFGRMLRDGASTPEGFLKPKSEAEMQAKIDSIDFAHLKASVAMNQNLAATPLQAALTETKSKAKSMVDAKAFSQDIAQFGAMTNKLKGVPAIPGDVLAPLRDQLDPAKLDAMRAWFDEDMAARGACYHDAANSGTGSLYLTSLAGFFRNKYANLDPKTRGDKIYDDLVKETIKGIGTHEIGHSLGLRHNFASSWDAPNYNPQYWQLRTAEGKASVACQTSRTGDADSCMGPRYLDPETRDEQGLADESRPGIDYFANTSTMEYQIERGGESVGLGTYDQHAMKVLYGRVIETFDPKDMDPEEQKNFALKNYTQLQEKDFVLNGNEIFSHYTNTARAMKVFDAKRDCRPATAEEKAANGWRIVHNQVCAPPPKDHWAFGDFETGPSEVAADIILQKWKAKTSEGKTNVRWNYRFGEQYGAGGYMHTTMMDAGADIYEITQNLTKSFELRYPWSYFRRGDREWIDEFLPQTTTSSYFSRVRAYHWQIALDIARARSAAELKNDNNLRPYVMAQSEIFSFLQRAALMPEPGDYATSKDASFGSSRPVFDLNANTSSSIPAAFNIGIGDGRYVGIDFENEKGGSWDYQKYVHHAGFEAEKSLALMQLVDPRPTLFTVARENYLDDRNVFISFRSDLPDGVDRMLGGILSEDWEAIAPHVIGDAASGVSILDVAAKSIARPQGARIVFPNIGYKQQLGMAINAALFSRLSSDMTLLNKMRISLDGDRAPIVTGTREVRFTDPATGYTWIGSKYGDEVIDGKTVDHGISSRMIGRANDLLLQAYTQKLDEQGKPMFDAKGQPVLATNADGKLVAKTPEAELRLRRYVGLLDAMRQISRALDGPLGGGGGGGGGDD